MAEAIAQESQRTLNSGLPGAMLGLYHRTMEDIMAREPRGVFSFMNFLRVNTQAFEPVGPVPARKDKLGFMAYNDAKLYYSFTSELYHKAMLVLTYLGYEQECDEPPGLHSVEAALGYVRNDLEGHGALELWDTAVRNYVTAAPLLAAKSVLPEHGRNPFALVSEALRFTLIQADFLYYLVTLNDSGWLLGSSYVSPSQKSNPHLPEVCDIILDEYYRNLSSMLERCA